MEVSDDTVRRRLDESNLRAKRHLRALPITLGNQGARLVWAQGHILWTNVNWANVLFSNESRFGS